MAIGEPKFETGKDVEERILGKVTENYEKVFGESRIGREPLFNRYTWVEITRRFQPFKDASHPKNPEKPGERFFPADVCNKIREMLGIKDDRQLRYYTSAAPYQARGLDKMSIDAFWELDLGGGSSVFAFADMTTNPEFDKPSGYVIILWPKKASQSEQKKEEILQWPALVADTANDIIEEFKIRAQENGMVVRPLTTYELDESIKMQVERHEQTLEVVRKTLQSINQKKKNQ
jgi:hypothetical protein